MKNLDLLVASKPADDTLPPQAREIVKMIHGSHDGLTREKLVGKLNGKLKTTQSIPRILSFYLPALKSKGFVKVTPHKAEKKKAA